MTSHSNAHSDVEEDDEYWERWSLNLYERRLVKPMTKPLTAPWDLAVSDSDVEKLKAGFRPRNQDDKWAWLIEDENGNLSIHIIRHFVRKDVYVLHITPRSSTDNGASAKIHSITWDEDVNKNKDIEQIKKYVVLLARAILECDFETLPYYAPGTV